MKLRCYFQLQNEMDDLRIKCLREKGTVLNSSAGYISVLLENIPNYVQDPAFSHQKVREINTIGRVHLKQNTNLVLTSCKVGESCTIYAKCNTMYSARPNKAIPTNSLHWDNVVEQGFYKFLGCLSCDNNLVILNVHFILNVEDLEACLKTLEITSRLCSTNIFQYFHSHAMKNEIEVWWKNSKEEENINDSQPV